MLGHHPASGRDAFVNDSRAESAGIGIQFSMVRRGRLLVFGEACVVFSKDRKAQPFEEFPVVLSLMSTLRGSRKCNKRAFCPDSVVFHLS